jgi:tetratricopeptide (TPR) repeat protein
LRALLLFVALALPCCALAQSPAQPDPLPRLQTLLAQKQWSDIVEVAQPISDRSAEVDYIYGIALANLGRYRDAEAAFLAGRGRSPNDSRFPTELAGIAFQQKQRDEAREWLRIALRLTPKDEYANDFLGTIYFLEGNLEESLTYWNRAGKPLVEGIHTEPHFRLDPVLLDRSLAFAPASVLTQSQLLASESRLRGLGVLPHFNVQLEARPDGKFDAVVRGQELNGFGDSKWAALLSTFRGAFFETATPEYYNLHGSATNITSLLRWDKNKRRFSGELSGPLRRDPRWRWQIAADLRNENWSLQNFSALPSFSLGELNMRRGAFSAEIASYHSGRWNWRSGGELSHRNFHGLATDPTLPARLFLDSNELKHFARLNYDLVRIPERRFFISTSASSEEGRVWSSAGSAFLKLRLSSSQNWFPRASNDDYQIQSKVSYGRTVGDVPFDELFMLGIERDNDLMLRAHVGTKDGRKGSAPLGRNYLLSNWEMDKNLYGNGLIRITVGPFLDAGKITDPDSSLGSSGWLYDTGVQFKLRVLGVGFAFTYGKDLRSGNNSFYAYLTR